MYFTKRVIEYPLDSVNILLINTISSACDIVTLDFYKDMKRIESGNYHIVNDAEILKMLKDRGYIFDNELDEDRFIEKYARIHSRLSENNSIKNYTICPTMGCNLRCTYCFEENLASKALLTMEKLEVILSFIENDLVKDESASSRTLISLFGGEPLLPANKPIIKRTLEFAKEKGIEVRIVTNGTTIKRFIDILSEYKNVALQITLDGSKPIHDIRRIKKNGGGTFDLIASNIDLLVSAEIKVHLRTNVNQENIDSLSNLIEYVRKKKWVESGFVFPYVAPVLDYCDGSNNSMTESKLYERVLEIEPDLGSKDSIIKSVSSPCVNYLQNFFDFSQSIKPWKLSYCEATSGSNFVFSTNGNVSTCLMLAGKTEHQIGVFDEKNIEINPKLSSQWKERNILNMDKCKKCKYALICGGGCAVAALDINNDIGCPVCSDIRETVNVFLNHKKKEILEKV